MPLIPGTTLTMSTLGVVTGTASSMALARGQANALYTVAPSFAAIDAAIAAEEAKDSPDADAIAALEDQKLAVVDAWNEMQAPIIIADSAAICAHILANLRITLTSEHDGMQRVPEDLTAYTYCAAPNPDFILEGAFT